MIRDLSIMLALVGACIVAVVGILMGEFGPFTVIGIIGLLGCAFAAQQIAGMIAHGRELERMKQQAKDWRN